VAEDRQQLSPATAPGHGHRLDAPAMDPRDDPPRRPRLPRRRPVRFDQQNPVLSLACRPKLAVPRSRDGDEIHKRATPSPKMARSVQPGCTERPMEDGAGKR
jgi:hypothetical protein